MRAGAALLFALLAADLLLAGLFVAGLWVVHARQRRRAAAAGEPIPGPASRDFLFLLASIGAVIAGAYALAWWLIG